MDMLPINWSIIANPFNWAIVLLMVVIGMFALGISLDWYQKNVVKHAS